MQIYEIKISKKRLPILIGKNGIIKKKIQHLTSTNLQINSETGLILIKGKDSLKTYLTKNIIEAIARGFNPDVALSLLDENNCFEIIPIQQFTGKNKKKLLRIKSRIIGTKGKCRKIIENLTSTEISIYGKTVCIIGRIENVNIAMQAVKDILSGAPHGPVYKTLQEKIKELKT